MALSFFSFGGMNVLLRTGAPQEGRALTKRTKGPRGLWSELRAIKSELSQGKGARDPIPHALQSQGGGGEGQPKWAFGASSPQSAQVGLKGVQLPIGEKPSSFRRGVTPTPVWGSTFCLGVPSPPRKARLQVPGSLRFRLGPARAQNNSPPHP